MSEDICGNYQKILIKTPELAKLLDVGISTVEQGRLTGRLPIPFIRLGGRSIRYRLEDVEKYIASLKAYNSTSEADEDK